MSKIKILKINPLYEGLNKITGEKKMKNVLRSLVLVLGLSLFLMACPTDSDPDPVVPVDPNAGKVVAEEYRGVYQRINTTSSQYRFTLTENQQIWSDTVTAWTEDNKLYINDSDGERIRGTFEGTDPILYIASSYNPNGTPIERDKDTYTYIKQ